MIFWSKTYGVRPNVNAAFSLKGNPLRVLLSAFEPYDVWEQNSSWEALIAYLHHHGIAQGVTTRRYPVDLALLKARLDKDLETGYDAILHLGQAPGISRVQMEAIALNVAGMTDAPGDFFGPLIEGAPIAYRTTFPLGQWNQELRASGIPCSVSYHAGTYLCNAIMFLSHHWHETRKRKCSIGFVHLPLTPEQVLHSYKDLPSMPREQSADAIAKMVGLILEWSPTTYLA